jgi:hypothetical protein
MNIRMHYHSNVTEHPLNDSDLNGSDNDVNSNLNSNNHNINAKAKKAALKAAKGTQKKLLKNKRVPQLLEKT